MIEVVREFKDPEGRVWHPGVYRVPPSLAASIIKAGAGSIYPPSIPTHGIPMGPDEVKR